MPHPILTVEDVTKSYDGFKAISNLTFYLYPGELRTIIGPNGAGKSSFFDLITGRARPDSGSIEFDSGSGPATNLTQLKEYQINRLGIGRKFQTPSVFEHHTIWENLLLSLSGARGVFASLFQRLDRSRRLRLEELLGQIRLGDKRHWKAGQLAHGEKQWLEIGMLLASDPKVLLIDEPAAGMTDEETYRTGELLLSLAGRHSLIVVEHDMTFVRQIARENTVTVLHQGSVLCEGRFDEVQSHPRVREVYLGRSRSH